MNGRIQYSFTTTMWQHDSPGGWFLVSLPEDISREIRENLQWQEEGWGRMRSVAGIGKLRWETAIWYDTKRKTYLLPVKAQIRKQAELEVNDKIDMSIWL